MKLKSDFYHITKMQRTDNGVNFTVHLNADHFIYAAHFPGNPVTPGVCLTQMVKELTEELTQESLFLKVVRNVKFTQVLNPLQHAEVTFALSIPKEDDTGYKVTAGVESGSETFAKLNLLFVKRN
jgi:3-hydroxyacyl-[acyl-carrier-protein] dehydratase